jgi:hypothetical protein
MAALELARICLFAAFAFCVLVLAFYLPTAGWWRTELGRSLVAVLLNLAVLLGYVDARALWPGQTPVWLALTIYAWLAASLGALAIATIRSWRTIRKGGLRRGADH